MKLLLMSAAALALAGCSARAPQTASAAGAAAGSISVHAFAAALDEWPGVYEATGTVRSRATTIISANWMGYVREVKVHVGDSVQAGQALISLDARDLDASSERASAAIAEIRGAVPEADAAIASAQSTLDLAQATFRRMEELYHTKSISDQEFDEASARLKAARSALEAAQARRTQLDPKLAAAGHALRQAEVARGYAEIAAPASGIVTIRSTEPGALAAPGAPLLTIESGGYRLEAQVEESNLSAVHPGQQVSVALDSFPVIPGRVGEIVPQIDSASRAYTVKIDLPPQKALRSGMFGRAGFPLASRRVLAVPAEAITRTGEIDSVFIAEESVARRRMVTVGARNANHVEVLSGLSPGDLVIFPIPPKMEDGARVEVTQESAHD